MVLTSVTSEKARAMQAPRAAAALFFIHAPRGATDAERSCCVLERRRPPLLSLGPLKRRKCASDAFICREARKSPETA